MSEFKVTALVCPDCAQPLVGLRHDKVFFCKACSQGCAPAPEGGWSRYPLSFAHVEDPPMEAIIYLPFWQLHVDAFATGANQKQEVASRMLDHLASVWVVGFALVRASYFGDLGLVYTEKGAVLTPAEIQPQGKHLAGCARGLEEAGRYAQLYTTLIIDKRADVTGMDIQVEVKGATLWAVPFIDQGEQIVDLVSGAELPIFAVDDLAELRRINRIST